MTTTVVEGIQDDYPGEDKWKKVWKQTIEKAAAACARSGISVGACFDLFVGIRDSAGVGEGCKWERKNFKELCFGGSNPSTGARGYHLVDMTFEEWVQWMKYPGLIPGTVRLD
mmetsp:Transcript_18564/g.39846  ORF Transcript_18564/g.39846 Transcript_18564/m.39846 type:complete len:113 (+) Transcript_18564:268-606(+)